MKIYKKGVKNRKNKKNVENETKNKVKSNKNLNYFRKNKQISQNYVYIIWFLAEYIV